MKTRNALPILFLLVAALLTAPLVAASPDQTIEDAQNALKRQGVDPGAIDGVIGPKTRSAIRQFQTNNHLHPTGRLDENTRELLGVKVDTRAVGLAGRSDEPVAANVEDESERVRKAGTVLSEIMGSPDQGIPGDLLEKSHAIAIIPHVVKDAFILGGRYGKGLIARRNEDGSWTAPAFITIGGGSVGCQIGGSATDLVLVFASEDGLRPLLKGKFTLGGDVSVTAGPVGRTASASTDITLSSAIYSYSRSKGLFAGVSLDGASISMDDDANETVYGSPLTGEDILLRDQARMNHAVRAFLLRDQTRMNHVVRAFIQSLQQYVPPHRH